MSVSCLLFSSFLTLLTSPLTFSTLSHAADNADVSFLYSPLNTTVLEDSKALFLCYPSAKLLLSLSPSSASPSSPHLSAALPSAIGPNFSIQWYWNDRKVDARRNRFEVSDGPMHSALLVNQAKRKLSGPIECKVTRSGSNEVVAASKAGYLTVIPKNEAPAGFPQTNQQNMPKTFEFSKRMFLSCGSSGNPEPMIQWFKDHVPINQSDPRVSVSGQTFQINEALLADAGDYECLASNPSGSSLSSAFTVFVKERTYGPYFSVKPANQEVSYGGSVSMRCVAVGLPFPKVEWRMENGSEVENAMLAEGTYNLTLKEVTRSMVLTCKGSSELGQVIHKIIITVKGDEAKSSVEKKTMKTESDDQEIGSGRPEMTSRSSGLSFESRPDPRPSFNAGPLSKQHLKDILTQLHTPYTPTPQVTIARNHTFLVRVEGPPQDSSFQEDIHHEWQYYLVVVPENIYNIKEPKDVELETATKDHPSLTNAWVAKQFTPSHFPVQLMFHGVGDEGTPRLFENRVLDLKKNSYKFFIRLLTNEGQEYSSEYSQPVDNVGRNGEMGEARRAGMGTDGLRSSPWLLIAAPLCLAVFFVLIIVFAIAFIRRKNSFSKRKMAYTSVRLLDQNDLLMNDARYSPNSNNADSYYSGSSAFNIKSTSNITPEPIPILLCNLPSKLQALKRNDEGLLHKEYESIDPGKQFTWEASIRQENACKNRYANVVAYDHSRVLLKPMYGAFSSSVNEFGGIESSDYINANYIAGANSKQYIATQGPMPETFGDFWRMVWQSRSGLVVMLTKLQERNKIKCDQYWPSEGVEVYGKCVKVALKDHLELPFYTVRTFIVSLTTSQESREIFHLQFTDWPEQGVPEHPTKMLHFINRMRCAHQLNTSAPIIIHCSAGVGRTGCVMAIDICLDQLQNYNNNKINGTNKLNNTCNKNNNNILTGSLNLTNTKFMTTSLTKAPSPTDSSPFSNYFTNTPTTPKEFFSLNDTSPSPIEPFHSNPTTSSLTLSTSSHHQPNPPLFPSNTTSSANTPSIDIFTVVNHLRSSRNYMVQSEDQYLFVYEAIAEAALTLHLTDIPSHHLRIHFCRLQQEQAGCGEGMAGGGKRMNKIELEFQCLSFINHPQSSFSTASLSCNFSKNTHSSILPLNSNRVVLQAIRGVEGSDYINASFLDGYRLKDAFIATQSPTATSVNDFWRMVWEKEVSVIVNLDYQDKCALYWPVEQSCRFNCFVIDPLPVQEHGCYVIRAFRMTDARDGQSRLISQFQLLDWWLEGRAFGVSGSQFSSMIGRVMAMRDHCQPIIVHCSKGAGRTGVFIGVCNVVERAEMEGVVNVHEAVKLLRIQRPGLVSTLAEYCFLYEALSEYLQPCLAK